MEQAKRLLMRPPPYDQAFIAQAIYILKQSVLVVQNLNSAIKRAKRGVKINGDYRPVDVERNYRMVDDYIAGMKIKDIAKKYDLSEGRTSHIILRMGGRKHARARVKKLSERSDPSGS